MAALQEINASASKDQSNTDPVASNLANLTNEIEARTSDDTRLSMVGQSLDMLYRITVTWDNFRKSLEASSRELTVYATDLEGLIAKLDQLDKIWQATLTAAQQPNTPPAVLQRVQSTTDSIGSTRKMVESVRANVLTLQTRLSEEQTRVQTALASVEKLQTNALKSLLVRDSPPLWSLGTVMGKDWSDQVGRSSFMLMKASMAFTERLPFTFLSHALTILVISVALQWMRRRIRKAPEKIQDLPRAMPIFDLPISSAFALSILFLPSIYPQAPRLIQAFMGAVVLIPTILILRRLLHRKLYPILNALVIIYVVSQVRILAASMANFSRFVYVGELVGTTIFLWWLLRSPDLKTAEGEIGDRILPRIRWMAKIGCVVLPAAFFANLFGYVNLGNVLGVIFLKSIFAAAALYGAIRILEGLIVVGLQVRPLNSFRVVRLYREMLQRRICLGLEALAILFWLNLTLNFFGLRKPLISAGEAALNANFDLGSLNVSPGRIIAFLITVWGAVLVSKFLRFLLEEDVYQHFRLARGIPYAISTMLHYVILVIGFFMALGALGIDLTKITIVAGAFSVGVGFGLQNIFNNFVSGIILLFERPIKIGDAIEVGGNVGEVQHIGIRASVIRTADGSEIIVPNGLLISSQVTNWTFSDRKRAVEISVSVIAGADIEHVTELLKLTAVSQVGVAKEPSPEVYVLSFTGGAVALQLRAWTDRYQDWAQLRSDLSKAVSSVLAREKIVLT